MTYLEFDNVEVITNVKCADCGDKLAEWEDRLCCICEAMAE